MSSTDVVVTIMAGLMIVMGAIIAKVSTRERGVGVAVAVLGAILLIAYLTAEPGAPSPASTATPAASPGVAS